MTDAQATELLEKLERLAVATDGVRDALLLAAAADVAPDLREAALDRLASLGIPEEVEP